MSRRRKTATAPDWKAAGRVLESRILKQESTITRWATTRNRGVTTTHRVCDGTYHYPNFVSLELLRWYATDLYPDDLDQQRYFYYEFIAEAGLLPRIKEISILAALDSIAKELRQVRSATLKLARRAKSE